MTEWVEVNPLPAFALLGLLCVGMGLLPVLLVGRFITHPHPSDEILRIRPRRWVRALAEWLLPACVLGIFLVAAVTVLRIARDVDAAVVLFAILLGFFLAVPFAGIVWAMRALFAAAVRATGSGIFLQGSFVRWADVAEVRRSRAGLELITPGSFLLRRRVLRGLGWELDDATVEGLRELWAAERES